MVASNFLLGSDIMCNLSTVSILRWNLVMLLSTLFWFSCSTSDNNEESNGKEGDETNVSVYLQQNGFQNLNLVQCACLQEYPFEWRDICSIENLE